MFERYTEAARRVLFFALREAANLGSAEIETEHLLLGLIAEDLVTQRVLGEAALAGIRARLGSVEAPLPEGSQAQRDLPLSAQSKRALAYAAEEAERLGDRTIRPSHLFVALLRETNGRAAEILREFKITAARARLLVRGADPVDISALETAALVWAGSMNQSLSAHHILLALLEDPQSSLAQFLRDHGITADSLCDEFEDPAQGAGQSG